MATVPTTPNPAPPGEWHHCPTCNQSLNYEPQQAPWQVGDIVLHDADAKEARLIMQVMVIVDEHTCLTRYVNCSVVTGKRDLQGLIEQRMCNLHDPKRWGIDPHAAYENREKPRGHRGMPRWERELLAIQVRCRHEWSTEPDGSYDIKPLYPCVKCGAVTTNPRKGEQHG